jgi:uncharacterized membrane protein
MVIMALDHTRDFIHAGAMSFSPEDLARTTPALFLTRWVTHICAPTFMFLAGLGAFLRLERNKSTAALSRFLVTRGLWLIVIELTVMRLAMNFTFAVAYPVILLVLTALGMSMIVLAALIHLPRPALAAMSIAVVALHNALDGVRAAQFGQFAAVWNILHQQGVFVCGGIAFVVAYPLVPWFAVMALGYCFGPVLKMPAEGRRRVLLRTGGAMSAGFIVLRAINVYGDPQPWSSQSSLPMTVLSFLRTTKYPPSLQFLLMTLGPALVALAALERTRSRLTHACNIIWRVPFFFYVVHFWLLHLVASALAWLRYGERSFAFLLSPLPSMGGSAKLFPPGFGYPLWAAYVVWIGVVIAMYPLCRRVAEFKRSRGSWWSSYL